MAATAVRIRIIEHLVGLNPEDELIPGQEYAIEPDYAARLLDAGYAELLDPELVVQPRKARKP